MALVRINFTHFQGVGFYEIASHSKKHLPQGRQRLPRWVVLKPPGVLWHRLPEAQADSWEPAACHLTGLTVDELDGYEIEIYDVASRRVLPLPQYRLVPAIAM